MAGEINKRLDHIKTTLSANVIAQEGYKHFKSITPIDTGNARNSTRLVGDEIQANYPYAQRLDTGHSRQAPKGMSQPTEDYIKQYIKKQGK